MNEKYKDALGLFLLQTTRLLNSLHTDEELSRQETLNILLQVHLLLITFEQLQKSNELHDQMKELNAPSKTAFRNDF